MYFFGFDVPLMSVILVIFIILLILIVILFLREQSQEKEIHQLEHKKVNSKKKK